jgi:hypothetical protein
MEREVRYLPPPGAQETAGEAARAAVERARRAGAPHDAYRDRRQPVRLREPQLTDDLTGRFDRPAQPVTHRSMRLLPAIDIDTAATSGFVAQRLAQERLRPGPFIDRSAQVAQAYAARAGYATQRMAVGGNVNLAV